MPKLGVWLWAGLILFGLVPMFGGIAFQSLEKQVADVMLYEPTEPRDYAERTQQAQRAEIPEVAAAKEASRIEEPTPVEEPVVALPTPKEPVNIGALVSAAGTLNTIIMSWVLLFVRMREPRKEQ